MSKKFQSVTAIIFVITLISVILFLDNETGFWRWTSIVLGTVLIYMILRILVDYLVYYIPEDRFDWEGNFFRIKPSEYRLFKKIRIREWEEKVPGYFSERYNTDVHSAEEVLFAMCEDEVKHWIWVGTNALVLVLGTAIFGGFAFFLITSLVMTAYDVLFALTLRYDRPRVKKIGVLKQSGAEL